MSCIASLYIMVDLSTVIKCLVNKLNYNIDDAEYIMSCISTWGAKLNVIVTSISAGIGVSLLPNITSDFAVNNLKGVREKTIKIITMLLIIVIPMVMGLSVLSRPVWTVFYGVSELGSTVFRISIFTALFCSLFNCIMIIMQSINRYKTIYLCLVLGILTKIVLNVPIMLLLENIGLNAYWGASIATIMGYAVSLLICFIDLKKVISIKYKKSIKNILVSVVGAVIMYIIIYLIQSFIPIKFNSRLMSIVEILIYTVLGIIIYGFILHKAKILVPLLKELKRKR